MSMDCVGVAIATCFPADQQVSLYSASQCEQAKGCSYGRWLPCESEDDDD